MVTGICSPSSTYLLHEVTTEPARDEVMNNLFTGDGDGIGLTTICTTIGSSDLSLIHYF